MPLVSFEVDAAPFYGKAMGLRSALNAMVAERLKAFMDDTMQYAQSTIEGRYSAGGRWATGELRDSGYVEPPVIASNVVSIEAGFGKEGPAGQYALFVHEGHHLIAWGHDTGINLPPTKFWEIPLMERAGQIESQVGVPLGSQIEALWNR